MAPGDFQALSIPIRGVVGHRQRRVASACGSALPSSSPSSCGDLKCPSRPCECATGEYSTAQRLAPQREVDALVAEYNRILSSTEFNGIRIFDGSDDSIRLQHGFGTANSTVLPVAQTLGRQAGDGTFGTSSLVLQAGFFGDIQDVDAADFNGDGNLDVAATTFLSHGVQIALGLLVLHHSIPPARRRCR